MFTMTYYYAVDGLALASPSHTLVRVYDVSREATARPLPPPQHAGVQVRGGVVEGLLTAAEVCCTKRQQPCAKLQEAAASAAQSPSEHSGLQRCCAVLCVPAWAPALSGRYWGRHTHNR